MSVITPCSEEGLIPFKAPLHYSLPSFDWATSKNTSAAGSIVPIHDKNDVMMKCHAEKKKQNSAEKHHYCI